MSKELRMLAYKNRVIQPAAPPPENTSPFAHLNPDDMSETKRRRLQSQINTVVFSTFAAIGNPSNSVTLRRKYCNKLRDMGIRHEQLHPWCRSDEARLVGNPDLDALEGGRGKRKQARRPQRRTRRRRNKTDVGVRSYRKTNKNDRRTLSNGGRRTRKQ
jgi:hypothetical protein